MGERVDSHGLLLPWDHCGTSSAAVLRGDDPMLAPQRRSGQHPVRTEGCKVLSGGRREGRVGKHRNHGGWPLASNLAKHFSSSRLVAREHSDHRSLRPVVSGIDDPGSDFGHQGVRQIVDDNDNRP